jgi:hypothetical protein
VIVRRSALAVAWAIAALLASACSSTVPAPKAIPLGKAACARCRHVIVSIEATAEAVYGDGTVRYYDDLGCMATDPVAQKGEAQLYVQLAGGRGWVRVEDINFAQFPGAKTARGYNYLAYPEDEARRADSANWARGWNDIVAELARKK